MKLPRRQFLHLAAGAAALPAVTRSAWAQTYPSRPVTLIVFVPAGGMLRGSVAARRHVELAGVRLGVGDKLGNRLGRNRWVHHHDVGCADDSRDWRDVADECEIELLVERRVDGIRLTDREKHIAIGGSTNDRFGGDIGACARPILDDEWLTEPFRQPLTHDAREDVECAARGHPNDDPHRPRRIGLRPSKARCSRQRGSARGQMQKSSAGKFHCTLPESFCGIVYQHLALLRPGASLAQ